MLRKATGGLALVLIVTKEVLGLLDGRAADAASVALDDTRRRWERKGASESWRFAPSGSSERAARRPKVGDGALIANEEGMGSIDVGNLLNDRQEINRGKTKIFANKFVGSSAFISELLACCFP